MTQTLYERAQRSDRRCMDCGKFPDTDYRHWRTCVPKRHWPEWARLGFATRMQWEAAVGAMRAAEANDSPSDMLAVAQAVAALIEMNTLRDRPTIADEIRAEGFACSECATVAKSAAGLAAHQRKHAREVINAGGNYALTGEVESEGDVNAADGGQR